MGTSSSNKGAGGDTPLIPTWLGSGEDGGSPPPRAPNLPPEAQPPAAPPFPPGPALPPPVLPPLPVPGDPKRFTAARNNFTRFITSGGTDRRSLGRALSGYVSNSMGGGRTAARRMAPSAQATGRLADFLTTASTSGLREALRSVGLERLAGQPIYVVMLAMTEFICPPGGSIDESIAREAFIETLADMAESGITDLDNLTPEQMQTLLESNIAHAIEARICNDIGNNVVALPDSPEAAESIRDIVYELVERSTADAFSTSPLGQGLTSQQTQTAIDHIYELAFGVLQTLAEAEAEKK